MRDKIPVGTIPKILADIDLPTSIHISESESGHAIEVTDKITYSNEHLEAMAREYADQIVRG